MTIHIIAKFIYQVENPVDWSRRVQNFVICLEMLFYAVAHVFVFPTEEWKPGYRPKERVKGKLGDNIGINDLSINSATSDKMFLDRLDAD